MKKARQKLLVSGLFDCVSLLNSRWFTKSILVAFSSFVKIHGGDEEDRTPDPLLAKQVLSQLSYTPTSFLKKAWQKLFISDLLQSAFKVHVLSSGSFPHFKLPFKVSSKSNNA